MSVEILAQLPLQMLSGRFFDGAAFVCDRLLLHLSIFARALVDLVREMCDFWTICAYFAFVRPGVRVHAFNYDRFLGKAQLFSESIRE